MTTQILLLALSSGVLLAQGPVVSAPAPPPSFFSQVADPSNLVMVTYGVAQIAESTTDWHFTVRGKEYSVSPAKRAAWAGGIGFGALALSYYAPKSRKWVTIGMGVLSGILAGRAYANSLTHGTPSAAAAPQAALSYH